MLLCVCNIRYKVSKMGYILTMTLTFRLNIGDTTYSCSSCNNGNNTNCNGVIAGSCSDDVSASLECLNLMYWICKADGVTQESWEAAADGCKHCTVLVEICATHCNYCDIAPGNIAFYHATFL